MNIMRKLAVALVAAVAVIGGGASATAQTPPGPVIYTEVPSVSCTTAGRYLHSYYFAGNRADPDYAYSALLVGVGVWNRGCMSYDITASSQSGYTRARGYAADRFRAAYPKALYPQYAPGGHTPPPFIKVNQPGTCRYSTALNLWYGC